MGFANDIRAFCDKAAKKASDNTMQAAQDTFKLVVSLSPSPSNPGPYAKGLLVNQYYVSVGNYSTEFGTALSDTGADSLARIDGLSSTNAFLGKDSVVYLSNSTEEAIYADKLGWAAGKGTNGWVWSGNSGPYLMRDQAIQYTLAAYS